MRRESVKSLDVVSLGPHARRSRLLYEQAFGAHARVDIIALPDAAYDPDRWWRSRESIRAVWGETLASLYSRALTFTD